MNERQLKKAIAETRKALCVVADLILRNEAVKREFPARSLLCDGNIASLEEEQRDLRAKLIELKRERDERKFKQTDM